MRHTAIKTTCSHVTSHNVSIIAIQDYFIVECLLKQLSSMVIGAKARLGKNYRRRNGAKSLNYISLRQAVRQHGASPEQEKPMN